MHHDDHRKRRPHHEDRHEDRHHEPPRHHEDRHYEPPRHHEDRHYEPPRHHDSYVFHHTHHELSFTVFRDRVEIVSSHGHGRHETIPIHEIHSAETHGFFGRKLHLRMRNGHDREYELGSSSDEAVHAIRRLIDHH